jgi:hypothetical protein
MGGSRRILLKTDSARLTKRPPSALYQLPRNNMRRLLSILATAFSLIGAAQARIGDTEGQIRTRYGDAITVLPSRARDAGLTKCYSSNHFLITVTYLNGHSAREIVTKADNSKISDGEIQTLLETNASGSSWNAQQLTGPKSVTAGVQQWRTAAPRSRVAIYDSQTRALFITNQQFIDLTKAQKPVATRANQRDVARAIGHAPRNMDLLGGGSGLPLGRNQAQPSGSPASK